MHKQAKRVPRVERRDIKALLCARITYVLHESRKQYFCETGAAYEIWDETELSPGHMLKRIPKKSVYWVSQFAEAERVDENWKESVFPAVSAG